MGKPAARIGDLSAHGGAIIVGAPTVLICGAPAARMGDMHVCPQVIPNIVPIPHVGGPIVLGSTGVLIAGAPAARLGDMMICTGPPDLIAMGAPNVLIGETMAGGGGAGGGGRAGAGEGTAALGALMSGQMAGTPAPSEGEGHFLDLTFEDKAGFPVGGVRYELTDPEKNTTSGMLSGQIKRTSVPEGEYTVKLRAITGARWSATQAEVGEKVQMLAEFAGFEDGEKVDFEVVERNFRRTDRRIALIEDITISGGKAEAEITYEIEEEEETTAADKVRGYSAPEYFFVVKAPGNLRMRSGLLEYKDWVEIELLDEEGKGCAKEEYLLHLGDGSVRKGKLDDNGCAKEVNILPGKCLVEFPAFRT